MMGKSTRFPNLRPKWLLTHPFGGFMGTEALRGLNLSTFSDVFFVAPKGYEDQYKFVDGFISEVKTFIDANIHIVLLETATSSQPETVYRCIKEKNINGMIVVKDSDNYFSADLSSDENFVCSFDLHQGNEFNARNKSYIEIDNNQFISNIVEKKIISSTFSVGGYGFKSAETFCTYFEKVYSLDNEIFMSNIIFEMLLDKHKFIGIATKDYEDWGTLDEWNKYKRTFKTFFVDMDGVLVTNTSPKTFPFTGTGNPLIKNISRLRQLYDTGRVKIIIVTARPESIRSQTENELNSHNIPYDYLLMNLPHSQRVIINDFADSNPHPSCLAINLHRDNDALENYI